MSSYKEATGSLYQSIYDLTQPTHNPWLWMMCENDYGWCEKLSFFVLTSSVGFFYAPSDLKPLNNAFIWIEVYKMLNYDHSQY